MEINPPDSPQAKSDHPPGKWAWPAILLVPVLLLAAERFIPSAESEANAQADLSLLAVLQVQAKLVIALDSVQPSDARNQLADLERYAKSDETVAAVVAVHGFLGLEEGGREAIERLLTERGDSPNADVAFLETVRLGVLEGADDEARAALRKRIGWFADLIGVEGSPGEPPNDGEIRNGAMAFLMLSGIFGLLGILAILTGAALLLIAFVARTNGRLRPAFDAEQQPARIFLESFAIFLLSMVIGNVCGMLIHWMMQPVVSLSGVILALIWPKLRGLAWRDVRHSLGLHRGRGWLREIGAGFVGYLIVLPMAIMGIAGTLALMGMVKLVQRISAGAADASTAGEIVAEPVTHPAIGWLLGGWEAKVMVFLLAAVLAPVIEEVFFRGAFYRSLRTRWGLLFAGLVNGFIFAALHPQGWLAIPALTAMGFGFACLREWRDSLIAPMTAHAINNGLLIGGLALILR